MCFDRIVLFYVIQLPKIGRMGGPVITMAVVTSVLVLVTIVVCVALYYV